MATRVDGYGSALMTPPTGMPDIEGLSLKNKKDNRDTPIGEDMEYHGNVKGCCSKPVVIGKGK